MSAEDFLPLCIHLSEKVVFGNGDIFHTVSSFLKEFFAECPSAGTCGKGKYPLQKIKAYGICTGFVFSICFFGKLKLIGESCSAFCTSSLQNFATVGGTHSFSEAVFFLSLKLLGLVCSKHLFAPP